MEVTERTSSEAVQEARGRYIARGIATPPLVVDRAEGARIWDVDGREYVDFAGGLGCQNAGHGPPAVVAAIHEQADRYLHQCFMVGMYEPYVDVCRRLAELSPCRGGEQKSILLNSGAEAVENAVKIARAATGRQAVLVFDRAFHGRTLLTMTMTSKVAYKKGFGPFAPEVYRVPAPYPYRGVATDDALAALATFFKSEVDPSTIACAILEPVQGEGGFVVMPEDYPRRLAEVLEGHGILYVDDEVQAGVGRTGPVWAIEHYGVEPDLLVSGKSLGGGLPLAAVTGRADLMDAPEPGGLGGTFGGNPLACAAGAIVLDQVAGDEFQARSAEIGLRVRAALDSMAGRIDAIGEVRSLGPMLALELVTDRVTKEPAGALATSTVAGARERGLVILSCGLHGSVVRILVPLVATDEELDRGLEILEEALEIAVAGAA